MSNIDLVLIKNSNIIASMEGFNKRKFIKRLSSECFNSRGIVADYFRKNCDYFLESEHTKWFCDNDTYELKVLYD